METKSGFLPAFCAGSGIWRGFAALLLGAVIGVLSLRIEYPAILEYLYYRVRY